MFKVAILAVLVISVHSIEHYGQGHQIDYYTEPHYSFAYEVKDTHTGDIKSQKEERQGEHTQGVYSLIEPDGSQRIVEYSVIGKSGFNANVHRDHSSHPQSYKSGNYHSGGSGYLLSNGGYGSALSSSNYQSRSGLSHGGLGGRLLIDGGHGSSLGLGLSGGYRSGLGGGYRSGLGSLGGLGGGYRSGGYGHGDATSSVQISTHGAKLYTTTKHIIPQKHY